LKPLQQRQCIATLRRRRDAAEETQQIAWTTVQAASATALPGNAFTTWTVAPTGVIEDRCITAEFIMRR
jgi:hypothetical protein